MQVGLNAPLVWSRNCAFCSSHEYTYTETLMIPWPSQDKLLSQQQNICSGCAWRLGLQCENCDRYKEISSETLRGLSEAADQTIHGQFCDTCARLPLLRCAYCSSPETIAVRHNGPPSAATISDQLYTAPDGSLICGFCYRNHLCGTCKKFHTTVRICQKLLHLHCATCMKDGYCQYCS